MTIVYGARCTWWDTIDQAGEKPVDGACELCGRKHLFGIPLRCERGEHTPHRGVPCCPNCQGALLEVEDERQWNAGLDAHPIIKWARGKCYPTFADLELAYAAVNA